MKKNKMMRIASVLLIAVLMTTCAISGTFAKYVTEANSEDSARVAKWGVTVTASTGASFADAYKTHDGEYSGALSVEADEKVVAPGTSSEDVDGEVTFVITGTPEVATRITFDVEATSEIKLDAGDYLDYTTADDTTDEFTLAEEYYPVKFTLTKTTDSGVETLVDAGTLSDVAAELNGENADYNAGVTLDVTYTLTWEWAFDGNDKADTYLGNEAPAQTLGYTLNVVVEQID